MTESQSTMQDKSPKTKKVSIQERSVQVGDLIVVNGYQINRERLKQRFAEGDYEARETDHFLLFTRSEAPSKILVHWFAQDEITADIKHYVAYELQPLGLVKRSADFGSILSGVIGSFFPEDAKRAWREFGAQTLQRFLLFLSTARTSQVFNFNATIGVFATWYQRVCELFVGESFLDAGCADGILPLVIAERMPFVQRSVGLDLRDDTFSVMREIAAEEHLVNVEYIQGDLLAKDFDRFGEYDTVVALGVIEHFTEEQAKQVLNNLLHVTSKRLIITIPYEQTPAIIYDHQQIFTREKLEALGTWCIEQLEGKGRMWCEECDGGLLLVERIQ